MSREESDGKNTLARYGKRLLVGSEAEESARQDIDAPYSEDDGDEEVMITVAETRGFVGSSTDALCGGKKVEPR